MPDLSADHSVSTAVAELLLEERRRVEYIASLALGHLADGDLETAAICLLRLTGAPIEVNRD